MNLPYTARLSLCDAWVDHSTGEPTVQKLFSQPRDHIKSINMLFYEAYPETPLESKENFALHMSNDAILPALQRANVRMREVHGNGYDFFGCVLPAIVEGARLMAELFRVTPAVEPTLRHMSQAAIATSQAVESLHRQAAAAAGVVSVSDHLEPQPPAAVPLLNQNESGQLRLLRSQVASILCASFLGIGPLPGPGGEYGDGNWFPILMSHEPIAAERVACQLNYFYHLARAGGVPNLCACEEVGRPPAGSSDYSKDYEDKHLIIYERISLHPREMPNWVQHKGVVVPFSQESRHHRPQPSVEIIGDMRIEDCLVGRGGDPVDAHVDFANEQVHIGCIIPSCTQEEVLFSIRPELFVAITLFQRLLPNEAGVVRGCRRYSRYDGYGSTFKFIGDAFSIGTCSATKDNGDDKSQSQHDGLPKPVPPPNTVFEDKPPAIVIVDAVVNRGHQFESPVMSRDLTKCYAGFCSTLIDGPLIATSHWGCGVFRGDKVLKFLQQLMVAAAAGRRLVYCCFGDLEHQAVFRDIAEALEAQEVRVGALFQWLAEIREQQSAVSCRDVIFQRLKLTKT